MAIKFTCTLPINLVDQVDFVAVPKKLRPFMPESMMHGEYAAVPVPPYPNPAVDRLWKKLRKVKNQKWEKKVEGNYITITAAE